ncbi:uncharacterized mitochondrial protein AtMg00860-like [Carya illinoinensis]|uniref:uncharacterized mitochondrial protein AtMg00860-like n=1 Tax=Carya illinoinensis TaxID=32201 RepID=UPI001C7194B2|nr:uncharacterized mitochondrial protein AtMg00860-like [Carya illinoinensis]
MVFAKGILVDPTKVEAVVKWVKPNNVNEVRSFSDFAGYYKKFIEGFLSIAAAMTKLTRNYEKFLLTNKCEESFQELKKRLVIAPILTIPLGDEGFVIYSDASLKGSSGVLNAEWESYCIHFLTIEIL